MLHCVMSCPALAFVLYGYGRGGHVSKGPFNSKTVHGFMSSVKVIKLSYHQYCQLSYADTYKFNVWCVADTIKMTIKMTLVTFTE